jgi:hypothetical protein
MAEGQSMTVPMSLRAVLAGEADDFPREAVTSVARELMEAEIIFGFAALALSAFCHGRAWSRSASSEPQGSRKTARVAVNPCR